jgi:hypothetical protein
MRAVEHLASTSLLLLGRKPEEERREILAKAQGLTEKLSCTVGEEAPLIGTLALLTAIRIHEGLIQQQGEQRKEPL